MPVVVGSSSRTASVTLTKVQKDGKTIGFEPIKSVSGTAKKGDAFKALGEKVDKNGVQVEASDAVQKEFVLFFEINGDAAKTRYVLYRNSVARPSIKGQTTENSITPATDSMTITAMPRENDHCTKGFIASDDTQHKAIYDGARATGDC